MKPSFVSLSATQAVRLRGLIACCLCSPFLLLGCSPAFDWRSMQWPEAGLKYQLPCKEDRHSKDMPLLDGGALLKVEMRGCEQQSLVFALAYAQAKTQPEAAAALLRWQKAYPQMPHLNVKTLLKENKIAVLTVLDTPLLEQQSQNKRNNARASEQDPARQQARDYFLSNVEWEP